MQEQALSTPLRAADAKRAVARHLAPRAVTAVEDRGVWVRHNFRVTLDDGSVVWLKAHVVRKYADPTEKEAYLCRLLSERGLPAPPVLALDVTQDIIPAPFLIQGHVGGARLCDLLQTAADDDLLAIYGALGRFFRGLHGITFDRAGWIHGDGQVLRQDPADFMFRRVIIETGREAVKAKRLWGRERTRLENLWEAQLDTLNDHTPTLVWGALPWTIYLDRIDGAWQVVKLTDLGDMLAWDPAWDLAGLRYPMFNERLSPRLWGAFLEEYGDLPEEKRLLLYLLVQRIDGGMGNYLAPDDVWREEWAVAATREFDRLLDVVDRMG